MGKDYQKALKTIENYLPKTSEDRKERKFRKDLYTLLDILGKNSPTKREILEIDGDNVWAHYYFGKRGYIHEKSRQMYVEYSEALPDEQIKYKDFLENLPMDYLIRLARNLRSICKPKVKKIDSGKKIGESFDIMKIPGFSKSSSKAIARERKKWETARKKR